MLSVVTGESITFGQGGEQKGIKFRLGHGYQQMPDICRKEATYMCTCTLRVYMYYCTRMQIPLEIKSLFLNHSTGQLT